MILTGEMIQEVIQELQTIAAQPKCTCSHGIGVQEEALMMTDWTRCKVCRGLIAATRYVEGDATLIFGTIQ